MSFEFAFTTVWNFFWAIVIVGIIGRVIYWVYDQIRNKDKKIEQFEDEYYYAYETPQERAERKMREAQEIRRAEEEEAKRIAEEKRLAEERKKEEEEKQKLQKWVEFYMKEKKRRLKVSKMSPLQKVLSKIPPLLGYLLLVATDGLFIYWAINMMLTYKPDDTANLIAVVVLLSPFIAFLIVPIVSILRRPSKFEKAKKILASNKTLAREIVKSMPNEG